MRAQPQQVEIVSLEEYPASSGFSNLNLVSQNIRKKPVVVRCEVLKNLAHHFCVIEWEDYQSRDWMKCVLCHK